MRAVISSAAASVLTLAVLIVRILTGVEARVAIADGFFSSGLLLVAFAVLSLVYREGGFDPFIYAASRLSAIFRSDAKGSYRSFKEKKASREEDSDKQKKSQRIPLAVGLIYLFVGIVLSLVA